MKRLKLSREFVFSVSGDEQLTGKRVTFILPSHFLMVIIVGPAWINRLNLIYKFPYRLAERKRKNTTEAKSRSSEHLVFIRRDSVKETSLIRQNKRLVLRVRLDNVQEHLYFPSPSLSFRIISDFEFGRFFDHLLWIV